MQKHGKLLLVSVLLLAAIFGAACDTRDCSDVTQDGTYSWNGDHVMVMDARVNGELRGADSELFDGIGTHEFSFDWFAAGINWDDIGDDDILEIRFTEFDQQGNLVVTDWERFDFTSVGEHQARCVNIRN